MMPFEKADIELAKKDSGYFRGIVLSQIEHLHECNHRVEKKIDDVVEKVHKLEHWKVKVSTIAAGLAVLFTTLFKYLLNGK